MQPSRPAAPMVRGSLPRPNLPAPGAAQMTAAFPLSLPKQADSPRTAGNWPSLFWSSSLQPQLPIAKTN